ncbi:RidA family protein [Nocardiopsis algeriensis]|uniref:RidA family protein n=1 Tax=Nocardiopsis algeriensis TaxID=1478215 RepID=UPI003B4337DB
MASLSSDALLADGPLLFVSGQTPRGPEGEVAVDVGGQTRRSLANVETVLARHGAGLEHLVKLTCYLRHITDLDEFRTALISALPEEHRPAVTLVEVSALVDPTFLVEIDAIACLPRRG